MKKILALVLALVMVMTVVCALAEGSKTQGDVSNAAVSTKAAEVELTLGKATADEKLQAVIDAVTEAGKAGDAVKGLPEDVQAKVPEDKKSINEMSVWEIAGDVAGVTDDELELVFKFDTPYEAGEELFVLIGISAPDAEEVEWLTLEGKANDKNEVVVKVTKAELNKIANNPFVVIPVSK